MQTGRPPAVHDSEALRKLHSFIKTLKREEIYADNHQNRENLRANIELKYHLEASEVYRKLEEKPTDVQLWRQQVFVSPIGFKVTDFDTVSID